jgi:hypothetical protein
VRAPHRSPTKGHPIETHMYRVFRPHMSIVPRLSRCDSVAGSRPCGVECKASKRCPSP